MTRVRLTSWWSSCARPRGPNDPALTAASLGMTGLRPLVHVPIFDAPARWSLTSPTTDRR
jgi:hypothetical protein